MTTVRQPNNRTGNDTGNYRKAWIISAMLCKHQTGICNMYI